MANRSSFVRRLALPAFLVCAALAAVAPSSASAGLLGTGEASYCDTSASQPFESWGDEAWYVLTPGGSFESGAQPWALRNGAKVVSGNETFYVRSTSDTRSLYLPAGGSAISPSTCYALGHWHLRLFVKNVGTSSGSLHVDVVVRSLTGVLSVLDGGTIKGGGTWAPSPKIELLLANVTSLLGNEAVSFRFQTVGTGAAFQIDDVYLDPWKFG